MTNVEKNEPVLHDYRQENLTSGRGVLEDKRNADGTIDLIVSGSSPLQGERILLTISQNSVDKDTAWLVTNVIETKNEISSSSRVTVKFEGTVVED